MGKVFKARKRVDMGINMNENFEHELAQKFAPLYKASEGEECYLTELEQQEKPRILRAYPAWNPFVYFSALRLHTKEDLVAYKINYFNIWDWDTGGLAGFLSAHEWDTERTALLVVGPKDEKDPDAFYAKESYYAAHEGAITDSSAHYPCMSKHCGVTVYWSKGKHASYPGLDKFPAYETFEEPGIESNPDGYTLVDIGTIDNPKVPWVLYRGGWGSKKVQSIYEKLRMRIWDKKTWERVERHCLPEVYVRIFQKYLGLRITGKWDLDTVKAAYAVNPQLIRNIQNYSEQEFLDIYSKKVRGVTSLLAEFSTGKIEKIVKSILYSHALEDEIEITI